MTEKELETSKTSTQTVEEMCTADVEKRRNQWHSNRRKEMLEKYPQIKELMTTCPWTALAMIVLISSHVVVAVLCAKYLTFLQSLPVLYFFNGVASHSGSILCHEITHNLAFKTPLYNKIFLWIASVPLIFKPLIFRFSHLIHHSFMEDLSVNPEYDGAASFDSEWYQLQKKLWHKILLAIPLYMPIDMLIYHLFYAKKAQTAAPRSNVYSTAALSDKLWLSTASWANLTFFIVFTFQFGWLATAYLILGESFSASNAHIILGARYLSEHITIKPGQPTNSMYGWQNYLTWNVGYHVEHHDFPNIPWNKVRMLHKIAPEYYTCLQEQYNYTTLTWMWLKGDPIASEENYMSYLSGRKIGHKVATE